MTTATTCTTHATWDYCGATRNAKTGVVEYKIYKCRNCTQRKYEPVVRKGEDT